MARISAVASLGEEGIRTPRTRCPRGNTLADSELRANRSRAQTYRLIGGPRPGGGPAQRSGGGELTDASWKTSLGLSKFGAIWMSAIGAAPLKHRTQCHALTACAALLSSGPAEGSWIEPSAEQICPIGQPASAFAIAGEITAAVSDKINHANTPKLSWRALRNWWNG